MNEKISNLWNNPKRPLVVVGIISLNVGIGFGYILGRRSKDIERETLSFEQQLSSNFSVDEIKELKEISERNRTTTIDISEPVSEIIKTDDSVIIDGQEFAIETLKKTKTETVVEIIEDEPEELITQSIFPDTTDDWDYALELSKRTTEEPYVIHKDEFYADEKDYTQSTLTYYSGDNIMCDEDDSPVYNHEEVIGELLFGHGSGDPNVVHIRNDKRKAEYEILFDPGLYSVEVLGLEIENNQRVEDLKHSKNRKFRLE